MSERQDDLRGRDDDPPEPAEAGAEAYGGDPDAEPSVTEDEVRRGSERDQVEG